ncbi:hypothetical protein UlMin_005204 [Ulmus minor]
MVQRHFQKQMSQFLKTLNVGDIMAMVMDVGKVKYMTEKLPKLLIGLYYTYINVIESHMVVKQEFIDPQTLANCHDRLGHPEKRSDLTHINNSIDNLALQRPKLAKMCLDSSYNVDLHKSISFAEKLQASLALELEKSRQEKLIVDHRSHSQLEMVKRTILDNLSNFRGHNKALEDCDRLVTEIWVLTVEVAKYKEYTRKSCAELDNLIVKSKALELFNIYTLYVHETCSSQRQRIYWEVEEQKRIVRDLQDRLVDAELQIVKGEKLRNIDYYDILNVSHVKVQPSFTYYYVLPVQINLGIYLQDEENEFPVLVDLSTRGSNISSQIVLLKSDYYVCIFAYGQTDSGKTYTMMGRPEPQDEKGLIPRSLEQIFQTSQSRQSQGWKYKMQYAIKHDANKYTHVYDLAIVDVSSIKDISSLLHQATQSRSVGKTQMNEQSSRSHVVFTLCISGVNEGTEQQVQGVLNLIDFAGSERLSRSGATENRLKETQGINKSLSSLTDVIFALVKKEDHVPFRNSKLTFLLQTLMFINISPDPSSVGESLCSLKFTTRVNDCEIGIP